MIEQFGTIADFHLVKRGLRDFSYSTKHNENIVSH